MLEMQLLCKDTQLIKTRVLGTVQQTVDVQVTLK